MTNAVYNRDDNHSNPEMSRLNAFPGKRDRLFFVLFFVLTLVMFELGCQFGNMSGMAVYLVMLFILTAVYLGKASLSTSLSILVFVCGIVLSLSFAFSHTAVLSFVNFVFVCFLYLLFVGYASRSFDDYSETMTSAGTVSSYYVKNSFREYSAPYRISKKSDHSAILKPLLGIAIGVLVSVPVLLIVVALLSSADVAFENVISSILDIDIGTHFLYIVATVAIAPFAVGAAFASRIKTVPAKTEYRKKSELNSYIKIGFYCAVALVYVLYLLSQLTYFFSAFFGILPEDMTFSAYARRGFFEISIVTGINLLLVYFSGLLKTSVKNKINGIIKSILIFISVFSIILVITAISKMFMYISNYGLTLLRMLTSVLMVYFVFCFIVSIVKLIVTRFSELRLVIIVTVLFLAAVTFLDPASFVADFNVNAYISNDGPVVLDDVDLNYLSKLGSSAVPAVYRLYTESNNAVIKEKAGKILEDISFIREINPEDLLPSAYDYEGKLNYKSYDLKAECNQPLPYYTLSRLRADNCLKQFNISTADTD